MAVLTLEHLARYRIGLFGWPKCKRLASLNGQVHDVLNDTVKQAVLKRLIINPQAKLLTSVAQQAHWLYDLCRRGIVSWDQLRALLGPALNASPPNSTAIWQGDRTMT
jgi:hypothetical protein